MRGAALGLVLLCAACGSAAPSQVTAQTLGLPLGAGRPLSSATLITSPDGGIYRNPDPFDVVLVQRVDLQPLRDLVGDGTWDQLARYGRLTVVGIRLRNDGKAGSDPVLNELQVASDLAPPGADSGALHTYYHPAFPLAALSDSALGTDCSVHLDPGQSVTVLLVYPPVRDVPLVTWGRYGDFTLKLPFGGGIPAGTGSLHAAACPRPEAQPA